MDNLNRLTRWDEWELGGKYRWLKFHLHDDVSECVSINRKDGYVTLKKGESLLKTRSWRNRYVKVI